MFTNNYYAYMKDGSFPYYDDNGLNSHITCSRGLKLDKITGMQTNTLSSIMAQIGGTFISTSSSSSYYLGLRFGDGSTPPTVDDYWLSGNPIDTYTATTAFTYTFDGNRSTIKCIYSITNTGDSAITIGEIGLFVSVKGVISSVSSSAKFYPMMIERSVLDAPVTIEPGAIGQVVYELHCDFPWAES